MQRHIDERRYHVEILTPKQNSEKIEDDLEKFAAKYNAVQEAGYCACITDNPMGMLSFKATECIDELGLSVSADGLLVHLNTFHTMPELTEVLTRYAEQGGRQLLIISGDGTERLHRLEPEEIGIDCETVTSVELLQYINREYPGQFNCGVAFNPYEPQDHEIEKMQRKIDAGAEFIITQPVIGKDARLAALDKFGLPVIIDAWMSKKLHLLSECVGYTIPEDTPYDPIKNLHELRRNYPHCGFYLALLGFKTQFPLLKSIWL